MRTIRHFVVSVALILFPCLVASIAGAQGAPASSANPEGTSADAKNAIDRAMGWALQGDAAAGVKALVGVPETSFKGEDADFRACMLSRFGSSHPEAIDLNLNLNVLDVWIASLATDYLTYWNRALTKPDERAQAEQELRAGVSKLLGRALANDADFDAAEEELKTEALKRGFHVLMGRTPPLRELMIWKKLTVEQRQVSLPEGTQSVRVSYLDDFVLRGWGYYATCSRRSAGGWATDEGLFAVVPAYKSLADETFSVRFLAHESQHFADKKNFLNLESWELEYRAKLVELSLADSSQSSTLQLICENQSESQTSPHGYADYRVIRDVTAYLRIKADDLCKSRMAVGQPLRDAAKAVLVEDTRMRRGKKQTEEHRGDASH